MRQSALWFLGIGIVFCISGILFFYKCVFEEDKKTLPSILLMIMGVVLIAIATARFMNLA